MSSTPPSTNDPLRDELFDLLAALCDQQLSDADAARLAARLRAEPNARRLYYEYIDLHGELRWDHAAPAARLPERKAAPTSAPPARPAARSANIRESTLAPQPMPTPVAKPAVGGRYGRDSTGFDPQELLAEQRWNVPARPRGRSLRMLASLAVVAAATIAAVAWWRGESPVDWLPRAAQPVVEHPLAVDAETLADAVAMVASMIDVAWGADQPPLSVGARLAAGDRLHLTQGSVELYLRGGARAVVQGPALVAVDAEMRLLVEFGAVGARAGEASTIGLSLRTPLLDVVDLGTEFGVLVDRHGGTLVAVHEGAVEVAVRGGDPHPAADPTTNPDASSPPHKVVLQAQQTARRLGRDKPLEIGQLAATQVGRDLRPDALLAPSILRWVGDLDWLAEPPASLALASAEGPPRMILFAERANVRPEFDTPVNLYRPGRYDSLLGGAGMLPAGQRVDSFLLHAEAGDTRAEHHATLRFERPIVGVIGARNLLLQTDRLFGAAGLAYPELAAQRQLEPGDVVVLSADRREITIHWTVDPGTADEVRILLASPPEPQL